jgi:tungstate transport system ATP-binding protein
MRPWATLNDVGLRLGRVQALAGVNLTIRSGERVAVIGANGGGKSSLLRVINGLLVPQTGSVQCEPTVLQGFVFQRPHMLRATVLDNVARGLMLQGVARARAQKEAMDALARVGLAELAQRNAKTLSGGQQQRLGLARALVLQPQVLLLDEPTANLDPHGKREVEALMGAFASDGMSLVFASHNLGQVKRLATRVLYMEHGRLLADLPVPAFFNETQLSQASTAAAEFVRGEWV